MKKILLTLIVGFCFFACTDKKDGSVQTAEAEMTQDQFNQFMEKFLAQENSQEKLGKAVQEYFEKQAKKAAEVEEQKEQVSFEDQFKNPVKVDIAGSPAR